MLRLRTSSFACVALLIALLSLPTITQAVPVAPGETVISTLEGTFTPTGTLEEDESRDLSLTFTASSDTTFDPEGLQTTTTVDGTFRQQIYRDAATNRLSFVYTVRLERPDLESIDLIASSFLGFAADVTGDLGSGEFQVTRSGDGATLTATSDQGLAGNGGTFAIFTDAENYDANGTLGIEAGAEFATFGPEGQSFPITGVVSDAFALDGIFQPLAQVEPPPPGGGVIPLPAAVWPGMILLGAVALKVRRAGKHGGRIA